MLASVGMFAQWTKPEVKGTDFVVGDTLYLYNVEAAAFFRGLGEGSGPYWGSRAGVATEGCDLVVFQPALYDLATGTKDAIEFMEEWDNTTLLFQNYSSHITKPRWDEVWFDLHDFVTIWTDRNANAGNNVNFFWNVTKNDAGCYSISVSPKAWELADEVFFDTLHVVKGGERLGVDLANADLLTVLEGYASENIGYNWKFVSKEEFESIDMNQYALYAAAMSLKAFIDESKAAYPTGDFSAAEAVYNNTASTLEELQAAKDIVKQVILDIQANEASPTDPKDMSAAIENATFDVIGDFKGWSGTAFAAGGTTSTCAEHYNKSSFNTYQDLAGLPLGIYKVSVKGFYRAGSISNDWDTKDNVNYRHAKLYARSASDSLYTNIPSLSAAGTEGNVVGGADNGHGFFVPNTMADFTAFKEAGYVSDVSVLIPVTDNTLRIGVVKNSHIDTDWCIVDDFTLLYYGNSDEAYMAWRDQVLENVPDIDAIIGESAYTESYKTAAEQAIETALTCTDRNLIPDAIKAINPAVEALQANIIAWQEWKDKVAEVDAYFAENDDLDGDSVYYMTDYLMDETAPGENYPNGGALYIAENLELTTEQVLEEVANVDRWFQSAIKNGMREGSNVSHLLVNPSFKEGWTGWTRGSGTYNTGGLDICKVVEVYGADDGSTVEVSQTVDNVTPGIYSISVQAFERPAGNGSYYGDEEPKVYLFMNDFETPVQNIVKDAMPEDLAEDKVNCMIGDGGGGFPNDYNVAGYGWVPNSVDGASYAFAYGRYEQKCYGIVGEDGVMKIGLTSHGQSVHWVLWANFKLIYEGKSDEAIASILEGTIEQVNTYLKNNIDMMTEVVALKVQGAVEGAQDAIGVDYETMYNALMALNAVNAEAKLNVEAMIKLGEVVTTLEEVYYEFGSSASEEANNAFNEAFSKYDGVANMTTEEVEALIAEMEYVASALKVPATDPNASDENPQDMTIVIPNADFSAGAGTNWVYTKNGGNGPVYDNAFNAGPGFEFWNGTVTNLRFDINQTLYALPEGKYTLAADLANSYNGQAEQTNGGRAHLYAMVIVGNDTVTYSTPVEPQTEGCNDLYANYTVTFDAPAPTPDTKIVVGVKTVGTMDARWFMGDNFTLMYFGTNSSKENSGDMTSIENVASGATVLSSKFYSIGGAEIATPQKGINIVRTIMSDGTVKVSKVFVK